MSNKRNEESWDKLAPYYKSAYIISVENYHYNSFGPGDNELSIIGDVQGLDILEVGCGGGQNAIVLAKQGAKSVTGIDQSENQLKFARQLAESQGAQATFLKSDMEDMSAIADSSFDLVVSSHAMNYASDISRVFNECSRVLRPNGRIVTCINHPTWIVLGEALQEDDFAKIVNYFDETKQKWDWTKYKGDKIATFESSEWQLNQIINGLISAGFYIESLTEPRGYTLEEIEKLPSDAMPYRNSDYTPEEFIRAGTVIPVTVIIKAIKKE
jgi:ubiquinone/menaquinone biosynthesis C-methylase UbiE